MLPDDSNTRVKFEDLDLETLPSGRCRSKVTLAWNEGNRFVGTAEGVSSEVGVLRCAAEGATFSAAEQHPGAIQGVREAQREISYAMAVD